MKDDDAKKGFVKLKMPTYYIAKHSDDDIQYSEADLQAAVAAEREACAKQYLDIMRDAVEQAVAKEREACAKLCESEGARIDASWESCAAAIRARGDKHD